MDDKRNEMTSQELTEYFQKRVDNGFIGLIGTQVVEYRKGYCRTKTKVRPELINPIGSVHGGCLYTIGDSTAGMSSIELGQPNSVTTIEGSMRFFNAAMNTEYIYAEGRVLKSGSRVVFTEVVLMGDDDRIFAKGSFTFAKIILKNIQPPAGQEA